MLEKNPEITNEYLIKGVLDVENTPGVLKQICNIIDQQTQKETELVFNFSECQQSSSVGLALLTSLLRYANEHQQNLQFRHLPGKLWAAAEVSNLDKVLPCV
jgi:ABC-type transporter Mla MlaB component